MRMPVSFLQDEGMGVRHRHREADLRHDAEVHHVVAHVGRLLGLELEIGEQFLEHRQLRIVPLVDVRYAERRHAFGYEL